LPRELSSVTWVPIVGPAAAHRFDAAVICDSFQFTQPVIRPHRFTHVKQPSAARPAGGRRFPCALVSAIGFSIKTSAPLAAFGPANS